MTTETTPANPPGGHAPLLILTSYDPTAERWHTHRTADIDDAAHAAQALAERHGWADVWRAYPEVVVHYDRVRVRPRGRRAGDAASDAVSLATSRWYAAIATGDLGLADAAWYVYSRVLEGAAGAAEMEAA